MNKHEQHMEDNMVILGDFYVVMNKNLRQIRERFQHDPNI